MSADMPGLLVSDLECIRDDRMLFSGLGFHLPPGQLLLVNGPNGSGKTTLLKALCALVAPEQGRVMWDGLPARRQVTDSDSQVLAYLAHSNGLKIDLSARENLELGLALAQQRATDDWLGKVLERVRLAGYEDILVRRFSAGMKRRLALARMLASGADLWVMDEPFTSLDSDGIALCEALIQEHCQSGGTVVMTSHHVINPGPIPVQQLQLGG